MSLYFPIFADIGAKALYLLYAWLLSAIGAGELSRRKGYGEKVGLGTGLLLSVVGLVIWIVLYFALPAKGAAANRPPSEAPATKADTELRSGQA